MTPDFEAAAIKAMKILIDNNITETPVSPLPILKRYPGVRVLSFSKMADNTDINRADLVPMFGANQDAATFHLTGIDGVSYVVVYNLQLPFEVVWRAVARELGHIVLGHDGLTRPPEIRYAEAKCFAYHLLTPRPVIHLLQQSGIPITMNVLSAVTGCSDECVDGMRAVPGVRVPAELNLAVRKQFERRINEYIRFHQASPNVDQSPVVDFGSYMSFYEE